MDPILQAQQIAAAQAELDTESRQQRRKKVQRFKKTLRARYLKQMVLKRKERNRARRNQPETL